MRGIWYIILVLMTASCTKPTPEPVFFEDDFTGAVLNEKFWNYEIGDGCPELCGWGNNELQVYSQENVSLRSGYLVLTASKGDSTYYSGRITTKDKIEFTYGTVEVRAKLPKGSGLWPAIWMLGANVDEKTWPSCGEIDIMEYVGKDPDIVFTSLHTSDSHGDTENTLKTKITDVTNDFHVYKMKWSPHTIIFYIDDTKVYEFAPDVKNNETWPFNKPFFLLMNMAVGGNFGGSNVDEDIFPNEFIIDYIKIYKS